MIRCNQCGQSNPILNTHCSDCQSVLTTSETFFDSKSPTLIDKERSFNSVESPSSTNPITHDNNHRNNIAEFTLEQLIGEGGMGKVYLATDNVLGRKVALKTLSEEKLSPQMTQRIIEEARLASVLNHDNIATVYSASSSADVPYIAMEWVEGESLDVAINQEKLSFQQSLNFALQVAKGMEHAHSHGIIHRDIKPANIMVCAKTGKVKVLDFGIAERYEAKQSTSEAPLEASDNFAKTTYGVLEGTINYMSPEQTQQKTLSLTSDVFSFGTVLHELFTGVNPFEDDNVKRTLNNIQQKSVPKKSLKRLPAELRKLVLSCLSKTPEQRPGFKQIVLILSRLYQQDVDRTQKNRSYWTSSWRLPTVVGALVLLVSFSAYYFLKPILSDRDHILAQGKKLAVLPFENLSADPMIEIYTKGLTFDLSNRLSEISSQNDGWIIPASEFFKLKDTSTEEVYKKHNVDWVIKGSVQHFGNERLLSVQLLNASDARVIKVFKESFTVETAFNAQNNIKQSIVQLLGWQVNSELPKRSAPISSAYHHYLQGMGYLYRYDYKDNLDAAIDSFSKSIEIDGAFEPAYYELTEAYIRKAKHDSDAATLSNAIDLSQTAVDRFNSSEAYRLSGMVNYRASRYEESERHFKQALTLNSNNDKAYYGLARLMQAINKNKQAEQYFKQAIALNENWIYWNYLAYFYYQTNRLDEAKGAYKQVASMTPNNVFGFQMIGAIAIAEGDFEQAKLPIEASIKLDPNNAYNHSNLGVTYFYLKEYNQAIDSFQNAVSLNDNSYIMQANLADSYRWASKANLADQTYDKAIKLIDKVIADRPLNEELTIRKASYLAKRGKIKDALALIPNAIEAKKAYTLILISYIYEIAGKRDKVTVYLTKAIKLGYSINNIKLDPEFSDYLKSTYGKALLNR